MTHLIGEPCLGVKDASCTTVCPVSCIHDVGDRFAIDAEVCIDCGACVVVCPVSAILPAADQPSEWRNTPTKLD
ncbi:MAG: 4Fe-4S binding protein [Erythrobacter sp.]|uniref:indolepyruvate ferredoxin oxidoreductase subunit alpha n=1 Tax=Erythrobacter sp. TaxID=1042 RepID=UPI002606EE21|nr:4Fe-4S binding protein [Erythrobacter sp.]MDJ0978667.1 4Fe-4S binding protein [Erythrobacter sp.]